MNFEFRKTTAEGPTDRFVRRQTEHRISLTLAVSDPQALWSAAAARLHAFPGMTMDDVLDVIGPREDPDLSECITAVATPAFIAGCIIGDVCVNSIRECSRQSDATAASSAYPLALAEMMPPAVPGRGVRHLAREVCLQIPE